LNPDEWVVELVDYRQLGIKPLDPAIKPLDPSIKLA
jgi:hypothetical protein